MDKLREALQALDAVDLAMQQNAERRGSATGYADGWHDCLRRVKSELRAALAEPVADEPVSTASAWWALVMCAAASLEDAANCLRDPDAKKIAEGAAKHYREKAQALYTLPAAQEPVAWMIECTNGFTGWWCGHVRGGLIDCRFFDKDPNKAVVFPSKESAEAVIQKIGHSCMRATSHQWMLPSTRPAADRAPLVSGDPLWLWRDGDRLLAYRHEYPCYSPGGDPMTLGEPVCRAEFRESHDRSSGIGAKP